MCISSCLHLIFNIHTLLLKTSFPEHAANCMDTAGNIMEHVLNVH